MNVSKGLWKLIRGRTAHLSLACAALSLGPALRAEDQSPTEANAQPASALQAHVRDMIAEVSEAAVDLDISVSRPKLIRGKLEIIRVSNSQPRTLKVSKVGERDLEIVGLRQGASVVTLWMGDGERARMLQINVTVKPAAPTARGEAAAPQVAGEAGPQSIKRVSARVDREGPPQFHPYDETQETPSVDSTTHAALEQNLNESFPKSRVKLFPVGNRLIVRGTACSAQEAGRILDYVRKQSGDGDMARTSSRDRSSADRVVNLLKVPGESQIRLRVQSVEIQRSALRQFCQQFDLRFDQQPEAIWNSSGAAPATLALETDAFQRYLGVLQSKGTVRLEDEPNHVVASGQSASLPATPATSPHTIARPPLGARAGQTQRFAPVLIPTLSGSGRFRFEFSAQPIRGPGGESNDSDEPEPGRSRATELRSGESLVVAGLNFRSVAPEYVLLLLVTPEVVAQRDTDSEPLLVPPERVKTTTSPYALKRSNTHTASIEAEQRSGSFYLSGPSGYSD